MDTKNERRKVNKLINKVKFNAYKLKECGSLPHFYFALVCKLSANDSLEKVRCYMLLADNLMRVKGFYFKYPEVQVELEKEAKEFLKERRFD